MYQAEGVIYDFASHNFWRNRTVSETIPITVPGGRYVMVGDTRLHIVERGQGYPLIVLHGGPGLDHTMFADYLDPLTGDHRLILVDQRSQGRSDRSDPTTWTLAQMARDVVDLAQSLGLDKYAVLGHSYGALVTLHASGETIPSCAADIRVFCSQAIVRTDVWGHWLEIQRHGEEALEAVEVPASTGAWEQFMAVREGRIPNPSPPEIGLRMARLWDAIRESARNGGRPVNIIAKDKVE